MSGQLCGCDPEQQWVCETHRVVNLGYDQQRAYNQRVSALSDVVERPALTPLDESLIDTQRIAVLLVDQLRDLAQRVEAMQTQRDQEQEHIEAVIWRNDRRHIAEVLAAFYRAPVSLSSLQPVLNLAVELNPELSK